MLWAAFAAFVFLAVGAGQHPVPAADARISREFRSMGTVLRIDVMASTRPAALAASEAAFREVQRIDALVSSWRRDSDMARLNAAGAHRPIHAPALATLVEELATWTAETDGAFDPAVGALIESWDLRGAGRRPTSDELAAALRQTGMRHLQFDTEQTTLEWGVDGAWMDAGGFGKGLALRAVVQVLDSLGVSSARIDFGGQVAALGTTEHGTWRVGIAHPRHRADRVAELRLQNASAATSGQSERHRMIEGEAVGHILDPRSGHPSPAWGSVTVVSADPMVADILATALFVLGPDRAIAWADRRRDVAVLILEVDDDGLLQRTNHMMERLLQ
jgi:thiamine biosynthesis lipoprotein